MVDELHQRDDQARLLIWHCGTLSTAAQTAPSTGSSTWSTTPTARAGYTASPVAADGMRRRAPAAARACSARSSSTAAAACWALRRRRQLRSTACNVRCRPRLQLDAHRPTARSASSRTPGASSRPELTPSRPAGAVPIGEIVLKKKQRSSHRRRARARPQPHRRRRGRTSTAASPSTRGAVAELRPGVLRDGEVADPVALAEALRELFAEQRASRRACASASPTSASSCARSTCRRDRRPEGARRRRPGRGARPHPDADGRGRPRLPVARRRQTRRAARARASWSSPSAARWSSALAAARRRRRPASSRASTSSAFGMVRALAPAERRGRGPLHQRRRPHQRRRRQRLGLPVHPRRRRRRSTPIAHTLAERRGLTLEHARAVDARTSASSTPLDEVEGDAELVAATRAALEEGVHQLADTVRNSLNFYRMQDGAETVERALAHRPRGRDPRLRRASSREQLRLPRRGRASSRSTATTSPTPAASTVAAGLAVDERV